MEEPVRRLVARHPHRPELLPDRRLVKASGKSIYVLSAVARAGTTMGTFTIAGLTGKAAAEVVGENRTVDASGGKMTDAFADSDVHLYRIDLSTVTCGPPTP